MASRALWKGAITFGLVHIPVALHSATGDFGLDFDWLDKRTLDPVGYKRINKKTGKEIGRDNIVKGIKYHKGEYIVLTDQEIADAYPKATQTIEIESFVASSDIPFNYLDRPYYQAPINKGKAVVQPDDPGEPVAAGSGAQEIDLTELLQRSLRKGAASVGDDAKGKTGAKTGEPKSSARKAASATAVKRRAA